MVVLGECFGAHQGAGGFYAKENERHFADPLFTPPSPPSYQQHPTLSSTAVDSPPNVLSSSTSASEQSTPTYTGMHLPLDADEVKTSDASKHDGEVKGLNSDEDEDADAEGEDDDGEWVPATQGGRVPSLTPQDYPLQHALPASSPGGTTPSVSVTTHAETSRIQPGDDAASNGHHHHSDVEDTARTDCADFLVNVTGAENDGPIRAIQPAVAGYGVAGVADASLNALNTAYVLNANTHGEEQNAGSVAPFDNFDIFLLDLPANPNAWATTQPERHIDVSPALSTSRRSPYSFTEEDLRNLSAYDASSSLQLFGAQGGSGEMFSDPRREHAQRVAMDGPRAETQVIPFGSDLISASGSHHASGWTASRTMFPRPSHYAMASSSSDTRFADSQSQSSASTAVTAEPSSSSSRTTVPARPLQRKRKAQTGAEGHGPAKQVRTYEAGHRSHRRNAPVLARPPQPTALAPPPLEYTRGGTALGCWQTLSGAGSSRLIANAANTQDSSNFLALMARLPASTAPWTPSAQAAFVSPSTSPPTSLTQANPNATVICEWRMPNGEICGYRYSQNIMKNWAMREEIANHLNVHKTRNLKDNYGVEYDAEGNLRWGTGRKALALKEGEELPTRQEDTRGYLIVCGMPGLNGTRCVLRSGKEALRHDGLAEHVYSQHYGMKRKRQTVHKGRGSAKSSGR